MNEPTDEAMLTATPQEWMESFYNTMDALPEPPSLQPSSTSQQHILSWDEGNRQRPWQQEQAQTSLQYQEVLLDVDVPNVHFARSMAAPAQQPLPHSGAPQTAVPAGEKAAGAKRAVRNSAEKSKHFRAKQRANVRGPWEGCRQATMEAMHAGGLWAASIPCM